jgi:hypothetical protein
VRGEQAADSAEAKGQVKKRVVTLFFGEEFLLVETVFPKF